MKSLESLWNADAAGVEEPKTCDAGAENWGGAGNGDEDSAAAGLDCGTKGDADGVASKALVPVAGASKPKPSDGSATWNGESVFLRSGSFVGFPKSAALSAAVSSATENGEFGLSAIAKGLSFTTASLATEKGESLGSPAWLGRVSKMPRFVFMVRKGMGWGARLLRYREHGYPIQPGSRACGRKNLLILIFDQ